MSSVPQLSKEEGSGGADEDYIQADCLLALDQPSPLDVNTIVFLGQAVSGSELITVLCPRVFNALCLFLTSVSQNKMIWQKNYI